MQADLFFKPPETTASVTTTAVYPNRVRDKLRVERILGLQETGDDDVVFVTFAGTRFAKGYVRIVYSDHGPYVEFRREQVLADLTRKFNRPPPADAYYDWLETKDGSCVKVYDQKRDVRNLRNPPAGGFRGNREEGYADYRPGMMYVSPYELRVLK